MKKLLKRVAYPLLVLIVAASCSSPKYASAQNDGYYDDNGSYNNRDYNDNRDYNNPNDQDDQNYNDQNYDDQNNGDYGYDDQNGNDYYDDGGNYEENPSDVTIDDFNDALTPYGRWEMSPSYGRVWIVNEPGFVPYSTGGHWLYTSYG